MISPDGVTLFFHRHNHPQNRAGGKESQDIWYSKQDKNGEWSKARRLPNIINQRKYNALKGVSPDGNTILIEGAYENGRFRGRGLSFSRKTDRGWSPPKKLIIEDYKEMAKGIYSSSSLSNDGKSLIMAFSEVYGSNYDDLYVSHLQEDSTWSRPESLGNDLNTKYTETTPFLASDGVTLHFSSNRPGGYGSNDIYMTKRLGDGWQEWSKPVNMGPEINSKAWEAYYSIDATGEYAFLVSSKDSYGKTDITKVKLKEELRPDPVVLISGTVYNAKTNQPLEAEISYEVLPSGENAGLAHSDNAGNYKIVLPYGDNYGFHAEADNFIPVSDNIDLTEISTYKTLTRDLYLVPYEVGETVRINNIFFDFGKATLRPESIPELKRMARLMNENPQLKIQVSGHTDAIGSKEDNLVLSNQRANAVKDYLVSQNINRGQIIAKGYGESQPVAENNSRENRQLNRRVEFTIIKK